MPVIKPRTRGKHLVEHRTRLDRDNHETLYAYAAFVEEEPDYVINQLVETVLAKDKELRSWRAAHAHSHAPRQCGARSTQAGTRSQCAAAAPWVAAAPSFDWMITWHFPLNNDLCQSAPLYLSGS